MILYSLTLGFAFALMFLLYSKPEHAGVHDIRNGKDITEKWNAATKYVAIGLVLCLGGMMMFPGNNYNGEIGKIVIIGVSKTAAGTVLYLNKIAFSCRYIHCIT